MSGPLFIRLAIGLAGLALAIAATVVPILPWSTLNG